MESSKAFRGLFLLLVFQNYRQCFAHEEIWHRDAGKGSLVGFTIVGETILDVVKLSLPSLSLSVVVPNATEVNIKGLTPSFSTAFCTSTNLFLIAINDILHPRIIAVDLIRRKVHGVIRVSGILIDNLECDQLGNGFAYVFLLGKKHSVIQIDFKHLTYTHLMHSSYKSYGGSTIDSENKRFFTVADLPYYESFNYSVSVLEYGKDNEWLTPSFKDHSIGAIVYDKGLKSFLGFVQTPSGVLEKKQYKTYLAKLDLQKGVVTYIAGPWPRLPLIEESGLTLDPVEHIVYVLTADKIRAFDLKQKKLIFDRSTVGIPRPAKTYEFVSVL